LEYLAIIPFIQLIKCVKNKQILHNIILCIKLILYLCNNKYDYNKTILIINNGLVNIFPNDHPSVASHFVSLKQQQIRLQQLQQAQ